MNKDIICKSIQLDDNDDLVNLRNLNGIRDRDKKTQFWTTFQELQVSMSPLLSLAQKKIERTQIPFTFSTAAHYLIDQLIKFRPYVIQMMKSVFIQQKVACLLDLFQMCSRMTH